MCVCVCVCVCTNTCTQCQVASESLEEEKVRSEAAKKSCEADFHKAQTSLVSFRPSLVLG